MQINLDKPWATILFVVLGWGGYYSRGTTKRGGGGGGGALIPRAVMLWVIE